MSDQNKMIIIIQFPYLFILLNISYEKSSFTILMPHAERREKFKEINWKTFFLLAKLMFSQTLTDWQSWRKIIVFYETSLDCQRLSLQKDNCMKRISYCMMLLEFFRSVKFLIPQTKILKFQILFWNF